MIGAHFITVLGELADVLRAMFAGRSRSVPIDDLIGAPLAVAFGVSGRPVNEFVRPDGLHIPAPPGLRGGFRRVDIVRDAGRIAVDDEPTPPGLIPCADCRTPQRPGAVHFAKLTDPHPCPASWRRG